MKKGIIKNKSIKWWLGTLACLVLFSAISMFAYMKMNFLFHGVELTASINKSHTSRLVSVEGNAKNAIYLSLNGREIFIDKDGSFTEQVALLPGLSVMTINAEDKFGKSTDKKIEIMYQESTGVVAVGKTIININ